MHIDGLPPATSGGRDRIVVLGCGTVGLPLAVALAVRGFEVCGHDTDAARVTSGNEGRIEIEEPALRADYAAAVAGGGLRFSTTLPVEPQSRCFVIAVPTPAGAGGFDRAPFDATVASILAVARPGDAVMVRSTVPIGTARSMAAGFAKRGLALDVTCCPDRTICGHSYGELFEIPHIIGAASEPARRRAVAILGALGPVIEVESLETAEAAKLFCNAQRNAIFGLANEFALICECLGLDIHAIQDAASQGYRRYTLPRPGPVGGPCLFKDTELLRTALPDPRVAPMIAAVGADNENLVDHAASLIGRHLAAASPGRATVGLLGIAFKGRPATRDTRRSFALTLAERLRANHPDLEIRGWDSEIASSHMASFGLVAAADAQAAARGAHVLVLANDHPALERLDLAAVAAVMNRPGLIYDLCGVQRGSRATLPPGIALQVLGVGTSAHAAVSGNLT